jgi:hypothetical protein
LNNREFAIASEMELPALIPPHGTIELELTFTPATTWGYKSDTLEIVSNDPYVPRIKVPLGGISVFKEPPPHVRIIAIQNHLERSVEAGNISGRSPDPFHAQSQVESIMSKLDSVGDLIAEGLYQQAYTQLESIYRLIDGEPAPPDLIEGPGMFKLTQMVGLLLQALTQI